MSLLHKTLREIREQLANKQLKVEELVESSFRRIAEVDDKVGAFLKLDEERARKTANELDAKLAANEQQGLLFGLPAGIKDNIVTENLTTTCASNMLANYEPVYDATVMKRLKEAQSVTIGKLNMDEFAMGGSNETSASHLVRNPWNLEHVPGGSSGGAAAAVASGQIYFALGSDTGGSIRQPAAYCGVVGLKPTYGLVSRFGLIGLASSFDQIGPITKNVEDAAYVLQAIAGYDPLDSTSAHRDVPDYASALTGDVKGLKIGIPKQYMGDGVSPQVKDAVSTALKQLEALGAVVEEVSLPHSEYAVAAYQILAAAEASSNMARFDGIRYGVRSNHADDLRDVYYKSRSEGFGPEVKRRILLGTYALSAGHYEAYFLKAQKVRTLIKQDFDKVFADYDLIVSPTNATTAFKLGMQIDDPLEMSLNDICTIPVNHAGIPAITVPCGFSDGLPIGLQIMGKAFDESTVLRAAYAYEQSTEFHTMRPSL